MPLFLQSLEYKKQKKNRNGEEQQTIKTQLESTSKDEL